jgi:hypothetical protein
MKKEYNAVATCFDFNDGGNDGPYALFSIGDKNMRVVVHMTREELKTVTAGPVRLTIEIEQREPPNAHPSPGGVAAPVHELVGRILTKEHK